MPQPIPTVPPRPQRPGAERRPTTVRPRAEPNPIRKVLFGLPVLLVALGFGSIVWLAYVEGQSSALGEPPLVKALPEPIKTLPDGTSFAGREQDSLDDLLDERSDRQPQGRLQPRPEEPILPEPAPDAVQPAATPEPEPGSQQFAARTPEPAANLEATADTEAADVLDAPAPAATPAPEASAPEAADAANAATASPPPQPTLVRPAPPAARSSQPAIAPPGNVLRRPTPTSPDPADTRVARVTPAPAEPTRPAISPSGVEQSTPGTWNRDRLRLEPPPPVLARAPLPTQTPAPAGAPPIIAAPGDDGRSATQPIYRIQLASVREEADARRAWDLYRLDLGDVLGGFAPVIERADIANGTFYRVQAGAFDDRLQAEAICDELKGRDVACLVVRR